MYQAFFHKVYTSGARLLIIKLSDLLKKIENPSENEREAIIEHRTWEYYKNKKRGQELHQFYDDHYDEEEAQCIFDYNSAGVGIATRNGISILVDTASKYYNVVNNSRVTTDCPATYSSMVYVVGSCHAAGLWAEDKYTLCSQLQRLFNVQEEKGIKVAHLGHWSDKFEVAARQFLSPKVNFKPTDFIVFISGEVDPTKCEEALKAFQDKKFYAYCDLSTVFKRPHEHGEVLFDSVHMSHKGYGILASHLYKIINILKNETRAVHVPDDLIPYMNYLAMLKRKRGNISGVIGSIVMNCNPFTLGHEHLIREALKRCDYLYVFVLDEDKSFFTFNDRIFMVKLGLKGVASVSVVPSGKTIISSETMPQYFNKDDIQDVKIDTSSDLSLFSLIIAPALNITKRFAGMEPFCQITKQYNDGMRKILPEHGIDFVELPRFSVDGREVSASFVRECIKNNDHEKIKNLVPLSTYNFLIEKKYLQIN